MLIASWTVLYIKYKPKIEKKEEEIVIFKEQYKGLGKASYEEKVVFLAFISLALLWIFRSGIKSSNNTILMLLSFLCGFTAVLLGSIMLALSLYFT